MTSESPPVFSVVIASRNRVDDLLIAIESALAQQETTVEVLVYDDASNDGSSDRVAAMYPGVRLFRSDSRKGYIVHRNSGYRDARGAYVISIDDDAYFSDCHTLARVAELFDQHPQAGAVALPFAEPLHVRGSGAMADLPVATQLRSFVGCAHAVRRELFEPLGGYRELLVHLGEERDFCIRLLEAGHSVIYADTPVVVHTVHPDRSHSRMTFYGCRNTLLFYALNVPQPFVIPRMLLSSLKLLAYRFRILDLPKRIGALTGGFAASLKYLAHRQPVQRDTYRTFRQLPGHGPVLWNTTVAVPPPVTRLQATAPPDAIQNDCH